MNGLYLEHLQGGDFQLNCTHLNTCTKNGNTETTYGLKVMTIETYADTLAVNLHFTVIQKQTL